MTLVEFVRSHAPGLFGDEITRYATDEELAALIEFHDNYIRVWQEAQYWKELMDNICNAIEERTKRGLISNSGEFLKGGAYV